MSCKCQKCGKQYKIDLMIPDHLWKLISPKKSEGGLLCGSCIMSSLENIDEYGYIHTKNLSIGNYNNKEDFANVIPVSDPKDIVKNFFDWYDKTVWSQHKKRDFEKIYGCYLKDRK